MQTPSSREEENIFTLSANRYFDEREKKWIKIVRVQTLWNWTFAVLFTLMLLTLAFVAKSFKDLNDYQRLYIDQKREQDAQLAREYRQNMQTWKEADNGKDTVVSK
jgi:hypothetical protein